MHIYGSLKKISGILFSSVEFKTALKKDIEISLLQKNLFKNKNNIEFTSIYSR